MRFRHTEAGGYRWVTNPNDVYIGKSLEVYGEWSFGEVALLRDHLTPDAAVVEVGANIGAHTVPLARHVHQGTVRCFEPQRIGFQLLCANIVGNDCVNVQATNAAVGAMPGKARIADLDPARPLNFGAVQVRGQGAAEADDTRTYVDVPLVTLDEALDPDRPVALIKCDAEGMEAEVLRGARETVSRHRPILYLEDDRTAHSQVLFETVRDMGYDIWWHGVPLFRPDNLASTRENIFGNVYSFNLLCFDKALNKTVEGLRKIETLADHPLLKNTQAGA